MPDDTALHHEGPTLPADFEVAADPAAGSAAHPDSAPPTTSWRRAIRPLGIAGLLYLVLAVAVWWQAWSGHPAGTSTCECGDPSLFVWFLEWPAYAITHGHWLFFASADFHGQGLNMLANTSVLGISVPLIPVTLLFGPTASMNVASTLAPALSALSLFWVARRWIHWTPAAFVAGLLYGFSPFVLTNAAYGHLMMTFLMVPPLVLACLDELLIRQRHRPRRVGLALALLLVYQFFISTEMLLIMFVTIGIGLVMLLVYAFYAHPDELTRKAPHAVHGLVITAVVGGVLLAYPALYAILGPDRFSGPVWPSLALQGGYVWNAYFGSQYTPANDTYAQILGYLGPSLPSPAFIGAALPAVIGAGLLVWRKDRRLWLFGGLTFFAMALSLGQKLDQPSIWWVVAKWPLFDDVGEQRFSAMAYLLLALMLGLVADHIHAYVRQRRPDLAALAAARRSRQSTVADRTPPWRRQFGFTGSGAVAWVALVGAVLPVVWVLGPRLPLTVETDYVPPWFTAAAPHLPANQVVLTYPTSSSALEGSLMWQALGNRDQHYQLVGGAGPEATPARAGAQRDAVTILDDLSVGPVQETGDPRELAQVRQAVAAWGTTLVVVPRSFSQSRYFVGKSGPYFVGFMTAVLGRPPAYTDGAWVWSAVQHSPPILELPRGTIVGCGNGPGSAPSAPPMAVPDCVMKAALTRTGVAR